MLFEPGWYKMDSVRRQFAKVITLRLTGKRVYKMKDLDYHVDVNMVFIVYKQICIIVIIAYALVYCYTIQYNPSIEVCPFNFLQTALSNDFFALFSLFYTLSSYIDLHACSSAKLSVFYKFYKRSYC